jgi:hypothetical protein
MVIESCEHTDKESLKIILFPMNILLHFKFLPYRKVEGIQRDSRTRKENDVLFNGDENGENGEG